MAMQPAPIQATWIGPAQDAPPVAPGPAETAGFVTFGSFNNLAKITPL
ncbi:TPR_REGION domain-containing protein, partial [Haematococcus lacustris]